jgi:hypothetical protein
MELKVGTHGLDLCVLRTMWFPFLPLSESPAGFNHKMGKYIINSTWSTILWVMSSLEAFFGEL